MVFYYPMIFFGGKINKDYGWEISGLHKLRNLNDGISFIELLISWDRYLGDHTPRFEIMFMLLNYKILEFNIYYLHHRDEEGNPCTVNSISLTQQNTTSTQNSQVSETQ